MSAAEVVEYGPKSGMRRHDPLIADLVVSLISGMICFHGEVLFHELRAHDIEPINR